MGTEFGMECWSGLIGEVDRKKKEKESEKDFLGWLRIWV